jgi:hypothetical protein
MSDRMTRERLAELKAANLPIMRATDVADIKEQGEEATKAMAILDDYLKIFVKPDEHGKCICCGARQGAKNIVDAMLEGAAFKWGLAHGEGFCSRCHYPARAYHFLKLDDSGEESRLCIILQYHPDGLSFDHP